MTHRNIFEWRAGAVYFAEVAGGVGWVLLLALSTLSFFLLPRAIGADGAEEGIARMQGGIMWNYIAGGFSVMLAAQLGSYHKTSRLDTFFTGGTAGSFIPLVLVSLFPAVVVMGWTAMLCLVNRWVGGGGLLEGVVVEAQYSVLFIVPVAACAGIGAGLGYRFGGAAGGAAGLALLVGGHLLPGLLGIASRRSGVEVEVLWAGIPHFSALDWSSGVIYMWKAGRWGAFFQCFGYGVAWGWLFLSLGMMAFRRKT